MSRQNYHLLFLILPALLTGCSIITTKQAKKVKTAEQLPGYYGQWLYIKSNGTNILPDVSKYDWMPANAKRATSDALTDVTEVGPTNIGGRTRAVVIDKKNPSRIIAGGVSGGIFISNDKGASWTAMNDQQITPSVTGMDQNPFLPEIIYYCTGEGSGNSADIIGAGVFKSTDGGLTFNQLPSTKNSNFNFCWSIKCSPQDTNVLYVSTANTGVWKSIDAGNTFSKVYSSTVEINDLEVLPDGSVLFTIKGGGVYRSPTGNSGTFTKVASISSSGTARGELAYCKNFPNVVYAAISGPDNSYNGVLQQFYKSSDGGKTFTAKTNPNGKVNFGFTWYCMNMSVKDNDSNSIFIASVSSGYSTDGASSWTAADDQHADHHVSANMVNNELLVGSDGGICIYKWSDFSRYTSLNNGLNITQFYAGAVSPFVSNIMGGTQDNGTNESVNGNKSFVRINGSDGGYAFYHHSASNIKYVSTQNGYVYRKENNTNFNITNNLPAGATSDLKWFIHPYDVSTFNSDQIIYPSSSNTYFSSDRGVSFKKLDKINSGRLFASNASADPNPAIYCGGANSLIAFDSVLNTKPLYTNLYLKLPLAMKGSFVNCIKVVPGYRDKIFVAYSNISDSGRVFMGSNVLSSTPVYKNISGNLPKGLPVNWVECDPANPLKTLFAGTDFGLYISNDSGVTWIKDSRIPNVVVSSIKVSINKKTIYFFTHGRGVFKGMINNGLVVGTGKIAHRVSNLKLYPVPASETLNIELTPEHIGATYSIYDTRGQLQKEGKLESILNTISTGELASGNYIFYIRNDGLSEHRIFNVLK